VRLRDRVLAIPTPPARSHAVVRHGERGEPLEARAPLMERVLGVHRDKLLPRSRAEPSSSGRARRAHRRQPGGEAVLFQTCYVQHNEPQLGATPSRCWRRTASTALRGASRAAACRPGSAATWTRCAAAAHQPRLLLPFVEAGRKVIAINPTCSMMMRASIRELVGRRDRERAERWRAAVVDPSEFLWAIRNEPRFSTAFKQLAGRRGRLPRAVPPARAGHRVQGRDLLRKLPGVESRRACSSAAGTTAPTP
jgi:hypothetical protein